MTLPAHWIEHCRSDREVVGWIAPEGDGFVPHDLLGRPRSAQPLDWLDAEEALEQLGIGYLADRYRLVLPGGGEGPVRIVEAGTEHVVVVGDDCGAASVVGGGTDRFTLRFPVGDELRPWVG